jgi:hypothetical protein
MGQLWRTGRPARGVVLLPEMYIRFTTSTDKSPSQEIDMAPERAQRSAGCRLAWVSPWAPGKRKSPSWAKSGSPGGILVGEGWSGFEDGSPGHPISKRDRDRLSRRPTRQRRLGRPEVGRVMRLRSPVSLPRSGLSGDGPPRRSASPRFARLSPHLQTLSLSRPRASTALAHRSASSNLELVSQGHLPDVTLHECLELPAPVRPLSRFPMRPARAFADARKVCLPPIWRSLPPAEPACRPSMPSVRQHVTVSVPASPRARSCWR